MTILNKDGTREFLEFDRNSIEDGIEINIIPGTLIPEDKVSRQQRVLQLLSTGFIDPISAYRELGFQNPEEMAKKSYVMARS